MRQIILSVLFILLSNRFAIANIINIPFDQPTIQAGIDAAVDGDTVLVQPGTYLENINFDGKNITVASIFLTTQDTSYISQTIIDGNQNGSVVTFENEENPGSILYGFSLINGSGNINFPYHCGGGIFCNNSNPSLLNLIITNNSAESDGGGIYFRDSSSPTLENVVISFNSTEGYGGGICCYANSNPSLENVIIIGNTSDWGGGVYCDYFCSPIFSNVTITNNQADAGGGIKFYYGCTPIFDIDNRCNIYLNLADYANDVFIDHCQTINLIVDTFTVLNPTNFHVLPVENCTFDILNRKSQQIDSDLYVSTEGSNLNSGLSFDDPLKTIRYAYSIIEVNSSNTHSIYLAPGTYSQYSTDEYFPVNCINFVSLVGSGENETILDACGLKKTLIFYKANYVTVKDISVINGLSVAGGGIGCYRSSPELLNMKIFDNTANDGGGIYCYANCNPILQNVTIFGNTANQDGGAIHCWNNCHLILINVTISNNSASRGGGIYNFHYSDLVLINSILWNDSPQEVYLDNIGSPASIVIAYTDIQGGEQGIVTSNPNEINWLEGNIDTYPLFIDSANGDFHLQNNSPCIDAGTAYFEWQGDVIIDLSPDEYIGIAPDMGAYEFGMQGIIDDTQIPINKIVIQNYPNPFNHETTITFSLSRNSKEVELNIYNIKGELVINLMNNKVMNSCKHFIQWDGKNNKGEEVSSNVYIYRLRVGDKSISKKMLLVR